MTASEPWGHTGSLIRRAQQAHAALWLRVVSADITSVQYGALAVIAQQSGISQKDLGNELGLDRSTIADLVQRLERNGLIAREPADDDRRRNVLALTRKGRATVTALRPSVEQVQQSLTATLDADEHAQLQRLLRRMLGVETDSG
jgi:DNA-binding MarR family transcriptional regulator